MKVDVSVPVRCRLFTTWPVSSLSVTVTSSESVTLKLCAEGSRCEVAAAGPPPRQPTVRYADVLAAAAKWRPAIVPQPPSTEEDLRADAALSSPGGPALPPPTHRSRYRPFVELLRRTFAIDLEICDRCGGRTKVIALVRDADGSAG